MPRLYNKTAGRWEAVPNELIPDAISSGMYEIPADLGVAITTDAGRVVVAQPSALRDAEQAGRVSTTEEVDASQRRLRAEREQGGIGGAIRTVLEQGASGVTLGASDVVAGALLGPDYRQARAEREEVRPGLAQVSRIAGAVAPSILSGGAGAAGTAARLTPAGAATRLGRSVAGEGGGVGRLALGGAVEGGLFGAGEGIHQLAVTQDDLSLERALSVLSSNALVGGVTGGLVGGAAGVASKGLGRARALVGRAREAREAAMGTSAAGEVTDDLASLDMRGLRAAEEGELGRIARERAPEREAIVADMADVRRQAKQDKPWIALEGFKGKEPPPVTPKNYFPKKLTAKVRSEAFRQDGKEFQIEAAGRSLGVEPWDDAAWSGRHTLAKGLPERFNVRVTTVGESGERITVGHAQFRVRDTELYPHTVEVLPAYQRKGIASRMYELAERRTGRRIIPSDTQTEAGAALSTAFRQRAGTLTPDGAGRPPTTAPLTEDQLAEALVTGRFPGAVGATDVPPGFATDVPSGGLILFSEAPEIRTGVPTFRDALATDYRDVAYVVKPSELLEGDITGIRPTADAPRLQRVASVRKAWEEGKNVPAVEIDVGPRGNMVVTDGNHRLLAAAQAGDRPVLVRFRPVEDLTPMDPIADMFPASARGPAKSATSVADTVLRREFRDIGKISFKADKQLDNLLDNPKALAENPRSALRALQQQEHALERLQKIEPELRARMAADPASSGSREAALDTLAGNLERNRGLQQRLQAVIADPDSARLAGIKAAREAIVEAASRPRSLAESFTQGAVFSGVAALASPLGFAAPILGGVAAKKASEFIFGRMARAGAAAAQRTEKALELLMSGAARAQKVAPPLASRTLAALRYLPGGEDRPKRQGLAEAYKARSEEILSQVELGPDGKLQMTQEARRAVADRLDGVAALDPIVADKIETHAARRVTHLAEKLPKQPDIIDESAGPIHWQPSSRDMRRWARMASVVDDPGAFEERLASGLITPDEAEIYRAIYPERFGEILQQLLTRLPQLKKRLPRDQRIALTLFTGIPLEPSLNPAVMSVMQGAYAEEPGTEGGTQAPVAEPAFGSISREPMTESQERAAR